MTPSCFPNETNLKHPIADFLGQGCRQIRESNAWMINYDFLWKRREGDGIGCFKGNDLPIATPTGLERLKRTFDQTKALTERSLCAMFKPRLKAITALWVITAMNTVIM